VIPLSLVVFFKFATTSGYDEWGLESTNLSIFSKPHRCLNLLIVADFPSAAKVSLLIKPHSFIAAVMHVFS